MISLINIKDSTGIRLVAIENDTITQTIKSHKSWEGHLVNLYYRIIKKNDIVLDVGANIGYHTLHFARIVGDNGHVISFEPHKVLFNILSSNILINNLSNRVTQKNYGLSSTNSKMFFCDIEDVTYDTENLVNYGGLNLKNEKTNNLEVRVKTLDSLNFDTEINFVKVDIEGMELEFLKGSISTLQLYTPTIFIEISKNKNKVIKILKDIGYVIYNVENHGNKNDYICVYPDNKDIVNLLKSNYIDKINLKIKEI